MNATDQLWAIEQIRQVKARFFRLLDTAQWDLWGDVFTEDVGLAMPTQASDDLKAGPIGRAGLVAARRAMPITEARHFGHMPEVEITGPDSATGVWSMAAYDGLPDGGVRRTFGWYEDEFRRCDDGRWRISKLGLSGLLQL